MIAAADLDDILARTEHLWHELSGERLFITGGTGFFGQWLVASFLRINDRLNLKAQAWVLSRAERRSDNPALVFVRGNVGDFDFPPGCFSHVVHGATTSAAETFHGQPALAKIDTVAGGTRRVLEFAAACGARKFLLTSSGNAYGPMPAGQSAFREDDLCAPDLEHPVASALGEAKRMAELLTRIYATNHGFEAKIGRCFTFLGPHLPLEIHYAMGNFIRDALDGGPVTAQGDGSQLRSWMYMTDLAVWLWTLLFQGTSNRLYNVGSDESITVGEAAERVARIAGTTVRLLNRPQSRPTASPSIYVPNTRRIMDELKVERTVTLDRAISNTLTYLRHHE